MPIGSVTGNWDLKVLSLDIGDVILDSNANRVVRQHMARRLKDLREMKIERPPRRKLSAKESLKRTEEFDKRKERFIAAIRKSKNRSLPA